MLWTLTNLFTNAVKIVKFKQYLIKHQMMFVGYEKKNMFQYLSLQVNDTSSVWLNSYVVFVVTKKLQMRLNVPSVTEILLPKETRMKRSLLLVYRSF